MDQNSNYLWLINTLMRVVGWSHHIQLLTLFDYSTEDPCKSNEDLLCFILPYLFLVII